MTAVFQMLAILMAMAFLLARKASLPVVIFGGALAAGLLAAMPIVGLVSAITRAVVDSGTWQLAGAVYLIMVVGVLMKRLGLFDLFLQSVAALRIRPALCLVSVPAMLGLLPVMGGAMLSAPAVQVLGGKLGLSPSRQTFINYWFRHVWEYMWPLYPGVILAAALAEVPVHKLSLVLLPFTLLAIVGGAFFGLRGLPPSVADTDECTVITAPGKDPATENGMTSPSPAVGQGREDRAQALLGTARASAPVMVVILLVFLVRLHILLALVLTIALLSVLGRLRLRDLGEDLVQAFSPQMMGTMLAVTVFGSVFESSGFAGRVAEELSLQGVPPLFIVVALPFMLGLMTGITAGAVGISFPVLLGWLRPAGTEAVLSYVVVAYVAGFLGVILSPAHLCLVLTTEYFGAAIDGVYRRLAAPVGAIGLFGAIYYLFL